MDAPFATVSRAVKKCTVTGKDYTVYVDGTVTESNTITIPAGVKVTVKSLTAGSTSGSDIDPTATIKPVNNGTSIDNMITVNSGATLTMTDITLAGNNTGRGINVTGGTCTLTNCIITKQKTSGSGAGIYIDGGTVTLNKTQIGGCMAETAGAGIYVTGSKSNLTMTSSIIGGNTVYNASALGNDMGNCSYTSGGGGVYIDNGRFTMEDGTISCNTALGDFGGGVYMQGGEFTMSGTAEINGNTAHDSSGGGGGVYMFAGTFTMNGGTISGNKAINGGGVGIAGGGFTMNSGSTIRGNTATYIAGGVGIAGGEFTMNSGSTISGNLASGGRVGDGGGGVYMLAGKFTMNGGTIGGSNPYVQAAENKTDMGNVGSSGGGVYMQGGEFNMSGTAEISGNAGSGVYIYTGEFKMSGTAKISGNRSTIGGGVYIYTGTFSLQGSPVIKDNTLLDDKTGNVYLCENNKITVTGAFDTGPSVGITADNAPRTFTTNFGTNASGNAPANVFFSDVSTYKITTDGDGEACLTAN